MPQGSSQLARGNLAEVADARPSSSMRRPDGFTLIEIMLAIVIALMVLSLAIPSVAGLFAEQRLKKTFDDFDGFVREAQRRSMSERRSFVMRWDGQGVTLEPEEPLEDEEPPEPLHLALPENSTMTLERTAALEKEPPMEWTFWRSGTCEPVIVGYRGPEGAWKVKYHPLTVRGTFLEQTVQ